MAKQKFCERIMARVFCHGPGGGNPVTIFANFASSDSERLIIPSIREELARGCEWESVFVTTSKLNGQPMMAFFMPTGEQVSFCAHAAIGGSTELFALSTTDEAVSNRISFGTVPMEDVPGDQSIVYHAARSTDGMISLEMVAPWIETMLKKDDEARLEAMLLDHHGVDLPYSNQKQQLQQQPTFCHSSIARNKTLVRVEYDVLQAARSPSHPQTYKADCDAINSTGLYLYARHPEEESAWVCRQFPRASGYPEDPATGIAAAALACSLAHHKCGSAGKGLKFYQGSTMGKPSLIVIDFLELDPCAEDNAKPGRRGKASFGLKGRVEIDSRETLFH